MDLGEEYCVFLKETYSPPVDLGAFWDSIVLADQVELGDFIHFSGSNESNQQSSHSLEEEIGGQLRAGFTLKALYEDRDRTGTLKDYAPQYVATLSEK